uniref:Uncharacterized protein n=1 Tax=Ralstonia solanacearum TaxID=305 RepID=A0A0S4WI64_RALSL|nr:protein of unknown function [Ralstonia solanacearum]CUV46464.1 protein of unknown function [Ralstonia solanacearum]CUV58291.1 protein of unknown function [Ralstonia solanacearum]
MQSVVQANLDLPSIILRERMTARRLRAYVA